VINQPFIWGVSASAAQTEGASLADGKGLSIWDTFCKKKRKIADQSTLEPGTDFYHRFGEDLDLVQDLKIPNFRFSISWPRVIPEGIGQINHKGIDFYDRLVDGCLQRGITPWITLYHWDLPHSLEVKGGWTNREVIDWFENYVNVCTTRLGDRVRNWMVLNEPMAYCGAGYFLGMHAPGRSGIKPFVKAALHTSLSLSRGADVVRRNVTQANIGSTFSMSDVEPLTDSDKDQLAAAKVDDLLNRFFLYPALGKGYPLKRLKFLHSITDHMQPGDENKLKADLDFIGLQNYTREVVKHSWITPYIKASLISAKKRNAPYTEMGWEVWPDSIYKSIAKVCSIPNVPPVIVTENGAAFVDTVDENGSVNDIKRLYYLRDHINMVMKAKSDGYDVRGYFVWSLTDNFEWAEGYRPRFGLVHIDYENNLKRTIKTSGRWYGNLIQMNGK
jgi:beta-glucosidase